MNIPFMRLDRQYQDNKDAFLGAVDAVFSHGRVLQGKEVAALEESMAAVFQAGHGVAVGSGTDALVLALKGLGLPQAVKGALADADEPFLSMSLDPAVAHEKDKISPVRVWT